MEFVPELVQHVNTRLVLGNPEDELGALRGREDSLDSRKISMGDGRRRGGQLSTKVTKSKSDILMRGWEGGGGHSLIYPPRSKTLCSRVLSPVNMLDLLIAGGDCQLIGAQQGAHVNLGSGRSVHSYI